MNWSGLRTSPLALRPRLRRSTDQAHRQLEAALAVEAACSRLDRYRDLLRLLWGVYAPLEQALSRLDWDRSADLVAARRKSPWLFEDLRSLGLTEAEIERSPSATVLPAIETPADAMGALYVLEGATLGGQVILPRVRALGLTADRGARFYAGYGRETGARWRAFVEILETFGSCGAAADRIEAAAIGTFGAFLDFAGRGANLAQCGDLAHGV